jgi:uncharacterized protein YndB with AHSA1/START domain
VTEIRVDVDLAHPPERVWRALTEAHLVTEWLSTSRFMVTEDRRFIFRATALKGLDDLIEGRVVTREPPHRLVMQWTSVNLHTTVTVTVHRVAAGARLTLVQQGFLGPHGAMRRRLLQRSYVELFEGPFTVTLDRLAVAVDAGSPAAAPVVDSKRNDGRAYERIPRQVRSASAPGLSSPVRGAAAAFASSDSGGTTSFDAPAVRSGARVVVSSRAAGASGGIVSPGFVGSSGVSSVGAAAGPSASGAVPVMAAVGGRSGSVVARVGRLVKAGLRRLGPGPSWTEDRRSQTVAASTALLLLLAMAALLIGRATATRPADPPQVGGGIEDSIEATVPAQPGSIRHLSPAPTRGDSGATSPSPAGALTQTATSSPLATEAVLAATYKTEKTRVSGYEASITIRNTGGASASDWTVVITLPLLGLSVSTVTGAVVTQSGKRFTFTPVDATSTPALGEAVRFTFEVAGLGHPDACTINGQPCAGVPG